MPDARIRDVVAREVLDSRGRPTVEAEIRLRDGTWGRGIAPAGASKGRHEAVELRDAIDKRYGGFGARRAVRSVQGPIRRALLGEPVEALRDLDLRLAETDGTRNRSRLGGNALTAVSLAIADAASKARGEWMYEFLARTFRRRPLVPTPMINVLSGGLHAGRNLEFQDFLLIPLGARGTSEALEWTSRVLGEVKRALARRGLTHALVADEGGFGPELERNEEALRILTAAIESAGLRAGRDAAIALDVASTHFHKGGRYVVAGKKLRPDQFQEQLDRLLARFPIVSLEDPFAEDDWTGWRSAGPAWSRRIQLLGDDLLVTNPARVKRAMRERAANAVLVKVNQAGSLTQAFDVIEQAEGGGWNAVVSARSGETEEAHLAHIAVASGMGQIKVGSLTRSERLAKYNELLRIEERLGKGRFAGRGPFRRFAA